MKKLLLGSVATGALVAAGSASAADLGPRPVYKATPVVAPIPVFSWTGCYVGAHGGWGWGKQDLREFTTSNNSSARVGTAFFGSFHGSNSSASTINTSGALFGGQIGCDYQFAGNFVLGVQGMFAGTGMSGDGVDPRDPNSKFDILHIRTDWIADVTARIGYSGLLPRTLVYVKGGPAWVRNRFDFRNADFTAAEGVFTQNRVGWTIGGGVEYAIAPNWSLFAEFDYYDFGTKNVVNGSHNFSCGSSSATTTCHSTAKIDVRQRIEAVKVGVSYRFDIGKGKAPIQARY